MSKITILLIGDISHDGRVLREINSLKKLGHEITLIFSRTSKPVETINIGAECIYIKKNSGGHPLKILLRNMVFYMKIYKILLKTAPDYVHCNDFNTFVMAFFRLKRIKFVYDAHELTIGYSSIIKEAILNLFEKLLLKKAYCVIVPQKDRLNLIKMKFKIPSSKLFLLENFPMKEKWNNENYFEKEYNYKVKGKQIISYSGGVSEGRYIKELILSMQYVNNSVLFIIGNPNVVLKKEIDKIINLYNLDSKVFLKPLADHNKVMQIAYSSDIGVCFYKPNCFNNYFSASNKLYEYLDAGTKVLTNITPSTLRVCNDANSYLVDRVTPENIAKGILALESLENPNRAEYYWENQESILKQIYN